MPLPEPVPGLVISYAYLWRNQRDQGRDEGLKDRPCVVVLAVKRGEGGQVLLVAPVTHAPPRTAREAIEVPTAVKRRLGLDDGRSWVVATELNRFTWPGPDLRPVPGRPGTFAYGLLPMLLTLELRNRISELRKLQRLQMVGRDDGQ